MLTVSPTKNPSDGNTDPGTTEGSEYVIQTISASGGTESSPDWKLIKPDDGDGHIWRTEKPVEAQSIHTITGATLVTVGGGNPVLTPLEIVTGTPSNANQVQVNPNQLDTSQQITFTFMDAVDLTTKHLLIEVPIVNKFITEKSNEKVLFCKDTKFNLDEWELVSISADGKQINALNIKITKLNKPVSNNIYEITFDDIDNSKNYSLTFYKKNDKTSPITIIASSALDSEVEITYKIASLTPSGIKTVCLFVEAKTKNDGLRLGSTRVVLTPTLTNGEIISALNSKLGTYLHFDLAKDDQQYADCALSSVDGRDQHSIVKILNCSKKGKFFVKNPSTGTFEAQPVAIELTDTGDDIENVKPSFGVDLEKYRKALDQYKDKRYNGCILADMTSKVSGADNSLKPMSADELRTLHYYLKGIAAERKDCTVLLSTPEEINTINGACDFALSQASDSTKWEYGETPTTDYTLQSFYLEMYYPWLKIKCTKLSDTTPVSVNETIAPTAIVLDNILKSYRERGVHYPVVVLNVIISALVMIPGLLFLRPILFSFGASEATILYAYEYMEIILWGNILTHLYFGNHLYLEGHVVVDTLEILLRQRVDVLVCGFTYDNKNSLHTRKDTI